MEESLTGLENLVRVVHDILIYGKDAQDNLMKVEAFLRRCEEKNIRLNVEKIELMKPEIEFAGLVMGTGFLTRSQKLSEISQDLNQSQI